ncbi:MAG: hypothetical protein ACK463_23150, partial [Bradyrhizobium sp.]
MSAATGTLDRRAAVKALLADRGGLLVISGLGSSSYDVFDAGDHAGNFSLWGAMGGAARDHLELRTQAGVAGLHAGLAEMAVVEHRNR